MRSAMQLGVPAAFALAGIVVGLLGSEWNYEDAAANSWAAFRGATAFLFLWLVLDVWSGRRVR